MAVVRITLNALTLLWYGSIIGIIYSGWVVRDERYIVAESGIGYWLGIIGGCMMLLLLVYPVRKKKPRWKYSGSIKFWFRLHMFLGIVGPVLIIFHSGYHLGSINGSVAFISMLIVASSGLVGRYFYQSIHHGLYGEKIKFEEVYHHSENWDKTIKWLQDNSPESAESLASIEKLLVNRQTGPKPSLWFYITHKWKLRKLRVSLKSALKSSAELKLILKVIWRLRSICSLGMNEILFSYWHILHYPLFLMLVFSGFIHVAVVHFY